MLRLYSDLAEWWPLLSPPEDYAEEASWYLHLLQESLDRPLGSMLELGSGGGHLASHVHPAVELVLLDLSPEMLAVSQALNPKREHVRADMREVRLGRQFDAVLLHDAVMYMASEADLAAALRTVAAHLRPGGAALILPDRIKEEFEDGCVMGGSDGEDGRAARFIEWHFDPDPEDDHYEVHFSFLLREADGAVTQVHEAHRFGIFDVSTWLRLLDEAGLELLDPPETPGFEVGVLLLLRRRA